MPSRKSKKNKSNKLYSVEKVLDYRTDKENNLEVKVKWLNYDNRFNSWVKREWIIDNPKVHEKEGDDVVLTNMKKLRKLRFSDVLEYAPIIFETEDENSFHNDETNSSTTPETSSFMISKSRFINYAPTVKYRRPELGESSQRNIIKIN